MRPIFVFLLSLLALSSYAENGNYVMSDEVNLPQAGWNKTLMMRNGNTMLFHFEMRKGIVVKVFDKNRKEVASQKHICNVLDINEFDRTGMKGVYDINGEAVLFFEQAYRNKRSLIRLRINADDGKLVEEKVMIESPAINNEISFKVLKGNGTDGYYVMCFYRNLHWNLSSKMELIQYNGKHEEGRHYPINVDGKEFTDLALLGGQVESNGAVCIAMSLASPDVTTVHEQDAYNKATSYKRFLSIYYLRNGDSSFIEKRIKVANEIIPAYTLSSYNSFTKAVNVVMESTQVEYKNNGIFTGRNIIRPALLVSIDENDFSNKYAWIANDSINAFIKQQGGASYYTGIPLCMYTNRNGVTTLVTEAYDCYLETESGRTWTYTNSGWVGITRFNSNCYEIGGRASLKEQLVKEQIMPSEFANRLTDRGMFSNLPLQDYSAQFMSSNNYIGERSYFSVYNETPVNFSKTISEPLDTISDYSYTDACYLTMDKNKELVKKHLFDTPSTEKEWRTCFIDGADFDDKTNTYATMVACRKGKEVTLKMAWCHLE